MAGGEASRYGKICSDFLVNLFQLLCLLPLYPIICQRDSLDSTKHGVIVPFSPKSSVGVFVPEL